MSNLFTERVLNMTAVTPQPEDYTGAVSYTHLVRPFFSDKFDITKHPRYQYLSDADKKNVFDVERYMKRRPAIVKPDEPFDMYELNASDLVSPDYRHELVHAPASWHRVLPVIFSVLAAVFCILSIACLLYTSRCV